MQQGNFTILITDDDEGHTILVQDSLRRGGLENAMLTFGDGHELLDFLHGLHPQHRFDPHTQYLLLLDIRMPKLDGVETLRRIKGDPALKNLHVIMLSTTDDPREVSRCHELGCSSYLMKPVDFALFANATGGMGLFFKSTYKTTLGLQEVSS
jgi:CheY-like chemotaxis protein